MWKRGGVRARYRPDGVAPSTRPLTLVLDGVADHADAYSFIVTNLTGRDELAGLVEGGLTRRSSPRPSSGLIVLSASRRPRPCRCPRWGGAPR